jgi:hypothetical protein
MLWLPEDCWCPDLGENQGQAERALQQELLLEACRALGEVLEQRQAPGEMDNPLARGILA